MADLVLLDSEEIKQKKQSKISKPKIGALVEDAMFKIAFSDPKSDHADYSRRNILPNFPHLKASKTLNDILNNHESIFAFSRF